MEFHEVIKTRRSIRSYRSDPIPDDVLLKVLNAVRIAPSGSNRQPWKFILVKDPELKMKLAIACGQQSFIAEAPVVAVGCGRNIHYNRGGYMGDYSVLVDVSIAMTHLILAARAEGLGTCWIGSFDNAKIKDLLNVPEDWNVVAVTPLGYPTEEGFSDRFTRKQLDDIVCYERFQ